jgi:hypothetical protein
MKVCIAFFGITRSLKYTINSINTNILDVLKNNDIKYDIYIHTFKLNNYYNYRAREKLDNVDNDEYKLLNYDYLQIDDQDEIKKEIQIEKYRTHKDPWNTGYNSVDNFILAQYSKYKLINMIEKTQINYDYVLFMRPDVEYINKLNIDYFKSVNNSTICIPNFHLYGKYNFNDRFSICNMNTYKIYGGIFKDLYEISKVQPLSSEQVLGEYIHNHKIKVNRIPFVFNRIRCDGRNNDNFSLQKYIEPNTEKQNKTIKPIFSNKTIKPIFSNKTIKPNTPKPNKTIKPNTPKPNKTIKPNTPKQNTDKQNTSKQNKTIKPNTPKQNKTIKPKTIKV